MASNRIKAHLIGAVWQGDACERADRSSVDRLCLRVWVCRSPCAWVLGTNKSRSQLQAGVECSLARVFESV